MRRIVRLASLAIAVGSLACADQGPGVSVRMWLSAHAIATGDTTPIALSMANTTLVPQVVDVECRSPFIVIDQLGRNVTDRGGILICTPEPPPGLPLEPGDTLVLFYRWAGQGWVDAGGGVFVSSRLPQGLYRIRGNLDDFAWPEDTVRILP